MGRPLSEPVGAGQGCARRLKILRGSEVDTGTKGLPLKLAIVVESKRVLQLLILIERNKADRIIGNRSGQGGRHS
jgi:hypothetical protein